jgi:hypothetical protein
VSAIVDNAAALSHPARRSSLVTPGRRCGDEPRPSFGGIAKW